MSTTELAPPQRSLLLRESRAVLDFASMLAPLARATVRSPATSEAPLVMVVPGFGSGDGYTLPLRRYLKSLGYAVEGWGLGTNLAGLNMPPQQHQLSARWSFAPREVYRGELGVPYLADQLIDRVIERARSTDRPIVLIGWSLGGFLAREVARELPDSIEQVITLGAPTVGGPKYTAAGRAFRRRGVDVDWIESQIAAREETPIRCPITAIFSKSDGVVGWQAAIDHNSPNIRHIEIDAAHLGMGFNQKIWSLIRESLQS